MTDTNAMLYLELLKKVLTNRIQMDNPTAWLAGPEDEPAANETQPTAFAAHTMVSPEGLDTVQHCVEQALADGVPGDLIETGVWRGGMCVLMRAVLKAHGVEDRRVWVADSFEGVPEAGEDSHPLDQEMALHNLNTVLSVSADTVRAIFKSYDLLDEQVEFLEGWFSETLPAAPIDSLAVFRLDGDLYESTMDSLTALYPKLSPGGFVIIDDYNMAPCRTAVHEYRDAHGIKEEIKPADSVGVYWRKEL
ncbi:TylF/MycF/NovP-related O-methyltransferase [Streptomyces sp. NPDC057445]|uniref:TylF/MycF/NovP-related O-methyltransferase n=1 Tax=Streptomyces sp. NPDC057445 TaxID=3346136 RepID=UPI0036AED885